MLRRMVRLEPPYLISILVTITLWNLSAAVTGYRGQTSMYSMEQIAAHVLYR